MKPIRYIVGAIGFLLVWGVVAIVVGYIVTMFVPPPHGETIRLGVGLDWRNLPGTILGLLAGIQSFRASVREPIKKDDK
jgi:Na+/H+-dicarboxylate symporter